MKRIVVVLLSLLLILPFSGCATMPMESTMPENEPTEAFEYPQINDKLTWEKIRAIPVKSSDMSVAEMRELCVSFFRFAKRALWTPDANFKYILNSDGAVDELTKGSLYGGVPYITKASGNVYRLMDYLDEETGVLDIKAATQNPALFGSQCSISAYWAWGRVINSAQHDWTQNMLHTKGFLRLGPYTYDDNRSHFSETDRTSDICEDNGEQVMYQSYAQLQPADGLVRYTAAGHVVMSSSVAHVEYIAGTDRIDGEKSYITIIDQTQSNPWQEYKNDSGDTFRHMSYVDKTRTFAYLFEKGFIPFTFAEFLGTDPVEETVCQCSLAGETVTVRDLFAGSVTANYGISDVYILVKDGSGKEVYRHAVRATKAGVMELQLLRNSDNVAKWGTLDVSAGEFTVEIQCQLATGERPTVYSGKLIP